MRTAWTVAVSVVLAFGALSLASAEEPPPTPAEEQPEVLTQGPMHEAFAEPVDLKPEAGLVAPDQPPPDVVEKPPEERPAGRRFVWVPGYWAWDPQRHGYVWVSGCWRAAPPERYWVPGYWSRTDAGWEWVAGFWAPVARVQEIEYLPAPPAIDTLGPPVPPPGLDQVWVPPCWYWRQGRYIWRPGYWLAARADWVWVPSHYVWAPRGHVFVAGHWDYLLPRRGVLFAPVRFPRPVYARPGFTLSLDVVVDLGVLQFSLFSCPRYSHFFFGDYYDPVNISFGIFPRYECVRRYAWYDPIYVHDRWRYRRVRPDWEAYEEREYDRRRADRDLRPPRTYREMEARQVRLPEAKRRGMQVAAPLTRVVAERTSPLKFERIGSEERQRLAGKAESVHKFGAERRNWELVKPGQGTPRPRGERDRDLKPSTGRGEPATSPAGREGKGAPREADRGPVTSSVEREPAGTRPSEGRGRVPAAAERELAPTALPEGRERAAPSVERARPVTPPAEGRERVDPSAERPRGATLSPEQRAPATAADRATTAPRRGYSPAAPERVEIPNPPVSDNRGVMKIFRKGPPASPTEEQKTEVRGSPRGGQAPAGRETQRGGGASRERR